MDEQKTIEFDLDYQGDSHDQAVDGCVVSFRRHRDRVHLGIVPAQSVWLTADQAESIGTNLIAAAEAVRREQANKRSALAAAARRSADALAREQATTADGSNSSTVDHG